VFNFGAPDQLPFDTYGSSAPKLRHAGGERQSVRYDFVPSRRLRDGIGKKVTDAPANSQVASSILGQSGLLSFRNQRDTCKDRFRNTDWYSNEMGNDKLHDSAEVLFAKPE
jgi:hypothetical protein